jgi:spermidine synthase/MFS family permease
MVYPSLFQSFTTNRFGRWRPGNAEWGSAHSYVWSCRAVAPHVGQSLTVWTSVIGIILAGICLGNVLGGRLADRVEPRRAVGPLFALGSLLTLGSLWVNAYVGDVLPSPDQMNWELRTVLVVVLDFLVPATVLGMVGPVVAKMAVERSRKAGSAIGDVYFWGAIGSIVGTFFCGFVLNAIAPTSTIVILVGAALALLAAVLMGGTIGLVAGIGAAVCLVLGTISPLTRMLNLGGVDLGSYQLNYLVLAGSAAAVVLGLAGLVEIVRARHADDLLLATTEKDKLIAGDVDTSQPRPGLADLAMLAFVASLAFMALEMVAGRLVQRHLGSSIYGWTSVIGVLLAGLSLGNFLGGKIADFVKNEKQASWLFLAASILTLTVLMAETMPAWFTNTFLGAQGDGKSFLSQAIILSKLEFGSTTIAMSWPYRILFVVTLVFFLPALSLGTVSPVVAKLAIDRLKQYKKTGTAIGQVYAWGMVGSLLGTFLTGFFLIDTFGTKGVILLIGTMMAFGATLLGSVWHAIWAGIPLGLCVLAFTPISFIDAIGKIAPFVKGASFEDIGKRWGIREQLGNPDDPASDLTWIDESKYYYIKVENQFEDQGEIQKRTLVLDNLIHGYFILDHPERLDYDYEHIYALVAYRAARASGNVTFKPPAPAPAPPETPDKDLKLPRPDAVGKKAESPAPAPRADKKDEPAKPPGGLKSVQAAGDPPKQKSSPDPATKETGDAKSVPLPKEPFAAPPEDAGMAAGDMPGSSVPGVEKSTMNTLFLGGGAYCFQRHMQFAYPGTGVDVAEIDHAVTEANFRATGLPRDTPIHTAWGDARQFVELNQDLKKYDLVFGDAFNDFSVPWHLTTREFNEKIKKMMTPNGVYMINIIDVYESDAEAEAQAVDTIQADKVTDPAQQARIRQQSLARAHNYGGFLGAWTETAKLTFPNIYVFGTDSTPGLKPLDFKDLGTRADDPKFYTKKSRTEPKPYGPADEAAVKIRSRNIILTDDYAPVDNLLAPVAETRGDDD